MKPIIKIENVSKQYQLGKSQQPYLTIRESLMSVIKAPIKRFRKDSSADSGDTLWALKNVSFEVSPGEVVAVIGRNGAGKSTLLKVLSRITEPTEGKIALYGRVGSLLEVGTGFHAELTGRENIFLNGAILGMRREEIAQKFDEIVSFAEVEKFIDTPVKFYSSGMYTRLAFAVAASLEPEILVVDEVLAVGDAEFQKKCLGKMKSVSDKQGRTVLFVSHNMAAVKSICQRGVVLKNGSLAFDGDIQAAADFYLQNGNDSSTFRQWDENSLPGNNNITIRSAGVYGKGKSVDEPIFTNDDLVVEIEFYNSSETGVIDVAWDLINAQGIHVAHLGAYGSSTSLGQGWFKTISILPRNILNADRFFFNVQFIRNLREILYRMEDLLVFDIEDGIQSRGSNFGKFPGVIHPICEWETIRINQHV